MVEIVLYFEETILDKLGLFVFFNVLFCHMSNVKSKYLDFTKDNKKINNSILTRNFRAVNIHVRWL